MASVGAGWVSLGSHCDHALKTSSRQAQKHTFQLESADTDLTHTAGEAAVAPVPQLVPSVARAPAKDSLTLGQRATKTSLHQATIFYAGVGPLW